MRRVVVVGGANLDQTAVASRLPEPGETLLANAYRETPGGKAANLASAAAAWGAPVSFVGRVGHDASGETLMAAWRAAGVDVDYVRRDPAGTGLGIVFMDGAGRYQTLVVPRANAALSADDVTSLPETLWHEAGVVALALEAPLAATRAAAEVGAVHSLPVVLNAAPWEGMDASLWPLVSHLIVNEHEAAALTNTPVTDIDSAASVATVLLQRLSAPRAAAVIVTLGAAGAVVARPDAAPAHVPAPQVTAVDTLGAGDTFVGVVSACLAVGDELMVSVASACTAAAHAVTVAGARAGVTPQHVRAASRATTNTTAVHDRPEGALA